MHPPDPDGERTPGPWWWLWAWKTGNCTLWYCECQKPRPIKHGQSLVLSGDRKMPTSLQKS